MAVGPMLIIVGLILLLIAIAAIAGIIALVIFLTKKK